MKSHKLVVEYVNVDDVITPFLYVMNKRMWLNRFERLFIVIFKVINVLVFIQFQFIAPFTNPVASMHRIHLLCMLLRNVLLLGVQKFFNVYLFS